MLDFKKLCGNFAVIVKGTWNVNPAVVKDFVTGV